MKRACGRIARQIHGQDHGDAKRNGQDGERYPHRFAGQRPNHEAPEKVEVCQHGGAFLTGRAATRFHLRFTSTILPSRSVTTTSAIEAASTLCVAMSVAVFCWRVRRNKSSRIWEPVALSRLPVGSSASSTLGA